MPVIPATTKDIPALVKLLNSAYRGEESKKGWTTEAYVVAGDLRTDEQAMKELMGSPGTFFLKYENDDAEIDGCVLLQKRGDKLYFGMFAVYPLSQGKGVGKELMKALETFAMSAKCTAVFMRVISVRHELISWYERLGYQLTGAKEPFPENDRFGTATQPLEFVIMEKQMSGLNFRQ